MEEQLLSDEECMNELKIDKAKFEEMVNGGQLSPVDAVGKRKFKAVDIESLSATSKIGVVPPTGSRSPVSGSKRVGAPGTVKRKGFAGKRPGTIRKAGGPSSSPLGKKKIGGTVKRDAPVAETNDAAQAEAPAAVALEAAKSKPCVWATMLLNLAFILALLACGILYMGAIGTSAGFGKKIGELCDATKGISIGAEEGPGIAEKAQTAIDGMTADSEAADATVNAVKVFLAE